MRRLTLYVVGFAVVLPIGFYGIYLASRSDPVPADSSVAEDIKKRHDDIPFLTAVLANDDTERRIQAAEFLARVDDPNAYEALVKVLWRDPDHEVRKTVIEILTRRGDGKAIDTLVCSISASDHPEDRDALVEALSEIGPPAKSLLHEYLASSDELKRHLAIVGLGLLKDATAVKPLAEILHDVGEDMQLRSGAASALGYIGDPAAVEPLTKALHGGMGSVHDSAAIALGNLREPEAIAPLLNILASSDPETRQQAVSALVRIGTPSVAPLLSRLNEASSPHERADLITALGRLGDRKAADSLIEILKNHSEEATVRASAADGLGQMQIEEAVQPFLAILRAKDEDVFVRGHVAAALRVAGAGAKEPLLTVISDPNESVALRRVCLSTLTDIGGSDVVDSLLRASRTTEHFKVVRYANALQGAFERFAIGIYTTMLLYADPNLNEWPPISSYILSQGRTSPEFLLGVLEDENSDNRTYAALHLGWLKEPRAVPVLCAMLRHEKSLVRNIAIWALGRIKDPDAVQPLINTALHHDDPSSCAFAAFSLLSYDKAARGELTKSYKAFLKVCRDSHENAMRRMSFVFLLLSCLEDSGVRSEIERSFVSILQRKEDEHEVRLGAASGLGLIPSRGAAEALRDVCTDNAEDLEVREWAIDAIARSARLTGNTEKWNTNGGSRTEKFVAAARSHKRYLGRAMVGPLSILVSDGHENVSIRCSAATALGAIDSEAAKESLKQCLDGVRPRGDITRSADDYLVFQTIKQALAD